jgi:hypothetical protein
MMIVEELDDILAIYSKLHERLEWKSIRICRLEISSLLRLRSRENILHI